MKMEVLCYAPHIPIQQATGLSHPILFDHNSISKDMSWWHRAVHGGWIRTYLIVLAYDLHEPLAARNGVYRVGLDMLASLWGRRRHQCVELCQHTKDWLRWHIPFTTLSPVSNWEELLWR